MSAYRQERPAGVAMIVRMRARDGQRDELLRVIGEAMAVGAEHEPEGVLSVTVHVSAADPNLVVLYDHFPGEAVLAEHTANQQRIPAMASAFGNIGALLAEPPDVIGPLEPVLRMTREGAG